MSILSVEYAGSVQRSVAAWSRAKGELYINVC